MQRNQSKTPISSGNMSQRIGIIVSSYNSDITYPIRDAAIETLVEAGIPRDNIEIYESPGAFEIPYLCQELAKKHYFNGLIAIGCVIRGDTDHYLFVASESTRGIMDVMLRHDIPIANAILTVNTLEQAQVRSQGDTNKGYEAARALLAVMSF